MKVQEETEYHDVTEVPNRAANNQEDAKTVSAPVAASSLNDEDAAARQELAGESPSDVDYENPERWHLRRTRKNGVPVHRYSLTMTNLYCRCGQ